MEAFYMLALLLLGHVTLTCQQEATDEEMIRRIDDFVEGVIECSGVPGLTLGVVKDGAPFLTKGYGVKNLDTEEPVTGQTLFALASVSKHIAAVTIGHMLKRHNLTYDTPVRNILGDWFYMKDPYLTSNLNVKDALAHRTGLPRHDYLRMNNFTKRELFERIRHLNTTAPPRTQYKYQNVMYGLAEFAAETVDGKAWEEVARDLIFNPLGMTFTTFSHLASDRWEEFATSYSRSSGLLRPVPFEGLEVRYGTASSPGGVASNAIDMAKWMAAQINEGRDEVGTPVLDNEILQQTHTPAMTNDRIPIFEKPIDPVTYADFDTYTIGLRKGYYRGHSLLGHSGTVLGYRSHLTILPYVGVGVYTSINGPMRPIFDSLHPFVMDIVLGKTPFLNVSDACDYILYGNGADDVTDSDYDISGPTDNVFNDYPTERLVGEYFNHAYDKISVTYDDTEDVLRLIYGPYLSFRLRQLVPGEPLYDGRAEEPLWTFTVSSVSFRDCLGVTGCENVEVAFDEESPPTFYRTLGPSPPPATPCPVS